VRLFVAVWPCRDIVTQLAAVPRPPIAGVRWTTEDQWHVTLRFLGEIDGAEPVLAALEPAATAAAPVAATLGSATSFVHGMIWATVEGLDLLAGRVIDATAALGAPPGPRPFRGHITLARQNQREQPAATRRALRAAAGVALSGTWTVEALEVVESQLHSRGARYRTVARLPLGR